MRLVAESAFHICAVAEQWTLDLAPPIGKRVQNAPLGACCNFLKNKALQVPTFVYKPRRFHQMKLCAGSMASCWTVEGRGNPVKGHNQTEMRSGSLETAHR